ncbi:CotS family spore coat protein [Symbiobacterium terraclitae]|uniref:CotS family spore coat protein n=1 Tax=Symbiobacterium terraclitae TaxID=557451 RepID=A0ABS4JQL1_9FIRM|nr:CotS family spore coat protein [Symbiobacterium terraclitae]
MNNRPATLFIPANTGIFVPSTTEAWIIRSGREPVPAPADPEDFWSRRSHAVAAALASARREDDARADDQVPPEILALAEQAARAWDMKVTGMTVAATKPEKGWGAIWRIETNRGTRALKLLHRPFERNLFSIGAQEYLVKQKARVAPLVPTRDGKLYTVVGGRMFIVAEWIQGLRQAPKETIDGPEMLCYGLGEFHRRSRGYQPPPGAYHASRLHRWPRVYQKLRTKLDWFEHLARAYRDMPASPLLLEVLPRFRNQADEAIRLLEESAYRDLIARGDQEWGLAHQDYGWSNGQIGPDGKVWIIDLDGVAFDLAFRDLRKLITGTMDDRGDWDVGWMRAMIRAYNEANPLEPAALQVMLIDMLLPNEFYKLVKDALFDPGMMLDATMVAALQRLLVTDERKQRALAELGLKRRR